MELNKQKLCALSWFYDYLPQQQNVGVSTERTALIYQLEEIKTSINANNDELHNLMEKLNNSEQPILKRIEWAAGSNPSLLDTVKTFETRRMQRTNTFKV